MDKKTTGIIATIATALLCGCPGACIILFGAVSAAGYGTSEINGSTTQISTSFGITLLCIGLIIFLIPIAVAAFSFWPKKKADAVITDEEIPPAIQKIFSKYIIPII